ncbi:MULTISPECIES: M23 family metallopeptidase [Citromicrobium]|uniref:M23 family metallopeptidase n=1 Tax=Citromicrobium TaxID=72173 RepID=UPI0001DD0986|nr:peptidase [Citromicrobium sp. JL477]KPM16567.1 peptidase [Citromicrobium sp. JL31]KPM18595.1 peptidase [Citromicrobium sp. JL1351]KPM29585.1 peptidase [Citromicrobium sp. JL2201]
MSLQPTKLAAATGASLAILLGSCSAPRGAGGPREVVQPVAAPTPSPTPRPVATPTPAPTPARTTFAFRGELEQGGWIRGQVPSNTRSARLGDQPLRFDEDGNFFGAFDRDQGPQIELVATLENGRTISSPLTIRPRDWKLEYINAPYRAGRSSAEFQRLRETERAQIVAARAQETGADGWRQDFIWPVTGRISGRFGSQRVYQGKPGPYHSGLDIAPGAGVPYVAPADGVVTLVAQDPFTLEGRLLMIDHGMGLNSAFLHSATIVVREGQRVKQGQYLGTIGATGRATGPHLHWSLKWQDSRLDPLLFVGPMPD